MSDFSTVPDSAPAPSAAPGLPTVFTTTWCPYCTRLTHELDQDGVPYTNVDVERDTAAATFVESVNGGNRVVPTVLYSDGSTATNPSASTVKATLAGLAQA